MRNPEPRNRHRARLPRGLVSACLAVCTTALPAAAQTLYVDELFGFQLSSGLLFASKPVGNPPGDLDLYLELYEPSGAPLPSGRPAIVAIHGGSFTGGTRFSSRMLELCERMAKRGWTCVSIDYRLQGDDPVVAPAYQTLEAAVALVDPGRAATIAAATEDTVAAIEWLQANAGALGIDASRIGLAGFSAGGALTEFVSYLADDTGVVLPGDPLGTFNMSGSFDPLVQIVQADEAAAFIVHGDQDSVVDVAGAVALAAQAQSVALPHELHVLAGIGHTNYDIYVAEVAPSETVFERFLDFFAANVAPPAPNPLPGLGGWGLGGLLLALLGAGLRASRG